MTRRWPWQLIVAALLVVLLATLATFQYRWLGAVSEAERERMRAGLRTRASELAQEFNSELTRTYVAFHLDSDDIDKDPAAALADAYTQWQSTATAPALVRAIYLAEGRTFDAAALRRFDPDRRTLEASAWPPELSAPFHHVPHPVPRLAGSPPELLMADALDSRIPALIIAVPHVTRIATDKLVNVFADSLGEARVVIVVLDAARLNHDVLEPLVAKHFGDRATSEYAVTIVRRDQANTVVYRSSEQPIEASAAEVTQGIFDLRMEELTRLPSARTPSDSMPEGADQRLAITMVRSANGPDGLRLFAGFGPGVDSAGAWQMRVRHRSGSLDAIVAQSRRRNLAISLGVLGLLAASVVLIIAAAQRQQRLARQQMEFVAAVSHELRTPLAVICSAGENLADGVVADAPGVKRYGTLIESEGRRLHDMVERVLEFAGVASGAPPRPHVDVDLARVIDDAVSGVRGEARERGVTIDVHANGSLPAVRGDAAALRSAVQNIVGNAVKYSAAGATVDVGAAVNGTTVQIRIADRGLGIDAADLPHVFKPFHRGRRAVEAQVRGTGIGLSVVRHVIDAHRGDVRIDSRPGEGTTVVVELPAPRESDTSDTAARGATPRP